MQVHATPPLVRVLHDPVLVPMLEGPLETSILLQVSVQLSFPVSVGLILLLLEEHVDVLLEPPRVLLPPWRHLAPPEQLLLLGYHHGYEVLRPLCYQLGPDPRELLLEVDPWWAGGHGYKGLPQQLWGYLHGY